MDGRTFDALVEPGLIHTNDYKRALEEYFPQVRLERFVRSLTQPIFPAEFHLGWVEDFYSESDNSARSPSETLARRKARAQAHWRDERAAGRGIEVQKTLTLQRLTELVPQGVAPFWNDRGRGFAIESFGAREVVGAHLLDLFASPQVNVSVCSLCQQPYQHEGRRPRRGVRRLCSEKCRRAARESVNLAAWHRNKDRYNARRRKGGATPEQ